VSDPSSILAMAQDVTTTAAVLVGGGWAYLKYVRGRVYADRAELNVTAGLYGASGELMAVAVVTLANKGLTRLRFQPGAKVIYLYTAPRMPSSQIVMPAEEKMVADEIFIGHDWLEAQESVSEQAVFVLPKDDWLTLRFEAQVWAARRRWRRRGVRWIASSVIPGPGWQRDGEKK
jgi:hypothetical protein